MPDTGALILLLVPRWRTAAHRLLVNWTYDRSPARLGRGDRRDRSLIGCPPRFGVAHSWRAPRRSPWRGGAPEGFAQLKVALPSSPISARCARGGLIEGDAALRRRGSQNLARLTGRQDAEPVDVEDAVAVGPCQELVAGG
jgi:hypothetical protein